MTDPKPKHKRRTRCRHCGQIKTVSGHAKTAKDYATGSCPDERNHR